MFWSERKTQITMQVKFITLFGWIYRFKVNLYTILYCTQNFFKSKNHLTENFQGSVKKSDYQLLKIEEYSGMLLQNSRVYAMEHRLHSILCICG